MHAGSDWVFICKWTGCACVSVCECMYDLVTVFCVGPQTHTQEFCLAVRRGSTHVLRVGWRQKKKYDKKKEVRFNPHHLL